MEYKYLVYRTEKVDEVELNYKLIKQEVSDLEDSITYYIPSNVTVLDYVLRYLLLYKPNEYIFYKGIETDISELDWLEIEIAPSIAFRTLLLNKILDKGEYTIITPTHKKHSKVLVKTGPHNFYNTFNISSSDRQYLKQYPYPLLKDSILKKLDSDSEFPHNLLCVEDIESLTNVPLLIEDINDILHYRLITLTKENPEYILGNAELFYHQGIEYVDCTIPNIINRLLEACSCTAVSVDNYLITQKVAVRLSSSRINYCDTDTILSIASQKKPVYFYITNSLPTVNNKFKSLHNITEDTVFIRILVSSVFDVKKAEEYLANYTKWLRYTIDIKQDINPKNPYSKKVSLYGYQNTLPFLNFSKSIDPKILDKDCIHFLIELTDNTEYSVGHTTIGSSLDFLLLFKKYFTTEELERVSIISQNSVYSNSITLESKDGIEILLNRILDNMESWGLSNLEIYLTIQYCLLVRDSRKITWSNRSKIEVPITQESIVELYDNLHSYKELNPLPNHIAYLLEEPALLYLIALSVNKGKGMLDILSSELKKRKGKDIIEYFKSITPNMTKPLYSILYFGYLHSTIISDLLIVYYNFFDQDFFNGAKKEVKAHLVNSLINTYNLIMKERYVTTHAINNDI
jgi:hypothetical protein